MTDQKHVKDHGEETARKMILGMGMIDGYGGLHGAWRAPHVDPATYADVDATVRHARAAERGKFAFLFTPDFPAVRGDVCTRRSAT